MDEQSTDAKTAEESSASADVTAASSTETAPQTDVKKPDLLAAAQRVFDKHEALRVKAESSTDEEDAGEESASKLDADKEGETSAEGEEGKEDTSESTQTAEDKGPIPYTRFKEVNEKFTSLQKDVETVFKPKAEVYDQWVSKLSEGNVAQEDFALAMDTLAVMNSDPAKAVANLKAVIKRLEEVTGEGDLPSDLATKLSGIDQAVEDGTLSPAHAATMRELAREAAKARGKSSMTEAQRQQLLQRQQAEGQRREYSNSVTALKGWLDSTQKTDADFQSGSKKHNYFFKLFQSDLTTLTNQLGRIPNPQETISQAVKTKTEVDNDFKGFRSAGRTSPGLSSTKSSTDKGKAKTLVGKVADALAAKGHKFTQE